MPPEVEALARKYLRKPVVVQVGRRSAAASTVAHAVYPVPREKKSEKYPLLNLKYLFDSGKLWLNPHYQREAVWVRSQKQLLIDSLLQDIDVPKLYFRAISHDGYELEVVDGQQRLTTLQIFLSAFRDFCREQTCEELAKEFEPTAQAIRNWVAQADRDAGRLRARGRLPETRPAPRVSGAVARAVGRDRGLGSDRCPALLITERTEG